MHWNKVKRSVGGKEYLCPVIGNVSSLQFYLNTLRPTLERVGMLANASDKILGLLPYKPAFGIVALDPDEPYGRILIEMYLRCTHTTLIRLPLLSS